MDRDDLGGPRGRTVTVAFTVFVVRTVTVSAGSGSAFSAVRGAAGGVTCGVVISSPED
ncbi:hypothetical protein ACFWZT_23040 [Streptomyces alboflavus]|uniref:hypothetical protein n=1 Tax=Streptomyces alboflavus TaxID=67267 RepID=UPI0036C0CE0F